MTSFGTCCGYVVADIAFDDRERRARQTEMEAFYDVHSPYYLLRLEVGTK